MLNLFTTLSSLSLLLHSHLLLGEPLAHWQHKPYLHSSFSQIALQGEHDESDGRLHKWQQPISYTVIDRTGDQALHQKMVTHHFEHLSSITGHKITSAANPATANVTVIFNSEQNLEHELLQSMGISDQKFRQSLSHNSVCVARITYDNSASINKAVVVIPVDRARAHGKLMACVVEELTQIMGLPNDSADVYPSIFNDFSFNDFLTGLDYLLLKLLYNRSLTSGMSDNEVKNTLIEITGSQEYSTLIHKAESLVRQNSLENWLD